MGACMWRARSEGEEYCPNCGQFTGGKSICPNCGAVLGETDGNNDMEGFHEENSELDDE